MIISNISQRLQEVNTLLAACKQDGITFEQALQFSLFYKDFNETNQIVKEAAAMFQYNAEQLNEISFSLFSEAEKFLSLDISGLQSVDFEGIFKEHLKSFEAKYDEARDIATGLWREYSAMSNLLDYLPLDSEDYKSLAPLCDAKKRNTKRPMHRQTGYIGNGSRNVTAPSAYIVSSRCSSPYWSKD